MLYRPALTLRAGVLQDVANKAWKAKMRVAELEEELRRGEQERDALRNQIEVGICMRAIVIYPEGRCLLTELLSVCVTLAVAQMWRHHGDADGAGTRAVAGCEHQLVGRVHASAARSTEDAGATV